MQCESMNNLFEEFNLFIFRVAFYFPSIFALSIMMSEKFDGLLSRSMFAGILTKNILHQQLYIL